ncbi:diguanylate cyclase [Magnetospirillum sp. SS-4]|uniref:GGDEF domain-containing response regulator n=1 Tax=Magnetospirillum sp. SS-4 TaxID=2681465 RepID=UPI0015745F8D|nr:diguanylate cyclase [Magnetospirillum sp. SS-4]
MPELASPTSREPKTPARGKMLLRRERRVRAEDAAARPWTVLVVDDEPDVHAMTRVLLRDQSFMDRPFQVVSAYSAAEAREILDSSADDIPVILLDVVMETPDAGLALVRHIREDLGNRRISIVLRTGQPGEAPERDVMLAYDINDYRGKTELTAQKLFTALVGGLRSWSSLTTIETLNATLEQRVEDRTCELDQARQFAENLVDMLPQPVWFKDSHGTLRMCNRAFRDMFGLSGNADRVPEALDEMDRRTDALLGREEAATVALEAGLDIGDEALTVMIRKGRLAEVCPGKGGTIGIITDITERKRMEHQLRQMATIDDLTGTFNRRAFFTVAEQEMERSVRYGNFVSLVMFDVDLFKQVNDRHGHAMGDRALRAVAEAMRSRLREVDLLGRIGGEEFAVLLPETPLAGAVEVAERLRQAIAAIALPLGGDLPALRLTASLGVAERNAEETSVDMVLARADAALYRAKAQGRNRVVA